MILVEGGNEVASKDFRNIAALATNYNDSNKDENCLIVDDIKSCLLYTSPSPRDATLSRMPSSA